MKPWNQGDRPPDVEENPGIQYHQRLEQAQPKAHYRYNHINNDMIVDPLVARWDIPQVSVYGQLEPDLLDCPN